MIAAAAVFGGEFGAMALAVGFVITSGVRGGFEAPGTIADRLVGSLEGEGVISALNCGPRLISLPHGLLATGVSDALGAIRSRRRNGG